MRFLVDPYGRIKDLSYSFNNLPFNQTKPTSNPFDHNRYSPKSTYDFVKDEWGRWVNRDK